MSNQAWLADPFFETKAHTDSPLDWDIDDPRIDEFPPADQERTRAMILDVKRMREVRAQIEAGGVGVRDEDGNVYLDYVNNRAGRRQFEKSHKKHAVRPGETT